MRRFLKEKVINGGAISGFHQLQEKYVGAVYEKEKEALKTHLAKKPVAVILMRLQMSREDPHCTPGEG